MEPAVTRYRVWVLRSCMPEDDPLLVPPVHMRQGRILVRTTTIRQVALDTVALVEVRYGCKPTLTEEPITP